MKYHIFNKMEKKKKKTAENFAENQSSVSRRK